MRRFVADPFAFQETALGQFDSILWRREENVVFCASVFLAVYVQPSLDLSEQLVVSHGFSHYVQGPRRDHRSSANCRYNQSLLSSIQLRWSG
jgi:hypothetical protein